MNLEDLRLEYPHPQIRRRFVVQLNYHKNHQDGYDIGGKIRRLLDSWQNFEHQ